MALSDHIYKILAALACFIIFNVGMFLMNDYQFGLPIPIMTNSNTPNTIKNSSSMPLTYASNQPKSNTRPRNKSWTSFSGWMRLPKLQIFRPKPTKPPLPNITHEELTFEKFCSLKTTGNQTGCALSPVKVFYNKYRERCLALRHPQNKTYCPCFPNTLVGWENQTVTIPLANSSLYNLDPKPLGILPGGRWKPAGCEPRQRVAIIVPYRKREEQLKVFAKRINIFMRRQQHEYQVFIIEQNKPKTFSRAALMNVGFLEANQSDFDCFIFSDVDLLPEDDRYMYDCFYSPLHIGAYVSKFKYRTLYTTIFGGVSALSKQHAHKTNLFGNRFYGWGGEDDDMYNRVMSARLTMYRYPGVIGRTFMIKHSGEKGNEYNKYAADGTRQYARDVYLKDGVRQTRYEVVKKAMAPLYTRVTINLLPLKPGPECLQKKGTNGTKDVYTICWGDPNFKSGNLDCCGKGCCHKSRKTARSPGTNIKKIT